MCFGFVVAQLEEHIGVSGPGPWFLPSVVTLCDGKSDLNNSGFGHQQGNRPKKKAQISTEFCFLFSLDALSCKSYITVSVIASDWSLCYCIITVLNTG